MNNDEQNVNSESGNENYEPNLHDNESNQIDDTDEIKQFIDESKVIDEEKAISFVTPETNVKAKKGNKGLVIGGVLAAIVIVVALSFNTIMLKLSPDKYLGAALLKTVGETYKYKQGKLGTAYLDIIANSYSQNLGMNFSKISIPNQEVPEFFNDFGVSTNLKVDRESKQAIFDMKAKKADAALLSFDFYLSNTEFGLGFPELYSKFFMLPTEDFTNKWNTSLLGQSSPIQQGADFSNLFDESFPSEVANYEQLLKNANDKASKILASNLSKMKFEDGGKKEFDYKGNKSSFQTINASMTSEDFKSVLKEVANVYVDEYFNAIGVANTEKLNSLYGFNIEAVKSSIADTLDSSDIGENVVITFAIDKGKVVIIQNDSDLDADPSTQNFVTTLQFAGEKKVGDIISYKLDFVNDLGENSKIFVSVDMSQSSNTKLHKKVTIETVSGEEVVNGDMLFSYDSAQPKDNFELVYNLNNSLKTFGFNIASKGTVALDEASKAINADLSLDKFDIISNGEALGFAGNIKYDISNNDAKVEKPVETEDLLSLDQNALFAIVMEMNGKLMEIPGVSKLLTGE